MRTTEDGTHMGDNQ